MIDQRHVDGVLVNVLGRILTTDSGRSDIPSKAVLIGSIKYKFLVGDSGANAESPKIIRAAFSRLRIVKSPRSQWNYHLLPNE